MFTISSISFFANFKSKILNLKSKVSIEVGTVLKLATQTLGDLYFEVTRIDASGIRLKYLCRTKEEQVFFEKKAFTQIYKSEIGKHYFEINDDEIVQLRKMVLREIYRLFVLLKYIL